MRILVLGGNALHEYMHNEDNVVAGDALAGKMHRSMIHMCYIAPGGVTTIPKERVIGCHTTSPTAYVPIKNRKSAMATFRVDNDTSANLCRVVPQDLHV